MTFRSDMRHTFRLVHKQARQRAQEALQAAPDGWVVSIGEPTRTLEQNAALWAALSDVSEQVDWYGKHLSPEEWKHVFSAGLNKQKVVPGLDGGFVVLGQSTSTMGKREFSELLELVYAFGVERGVKFDQG